MGWKSIHWGRSEYPQRTRREVYADDSWMLLVSPLGRSYIAFKGRPNERRLARIRNARRDASESVKGVEW